MSRKLPKIGTRSAMSPGNAGERATRKITRRVWLSFAAGGALAALGGERWWRWHNPRIIDPKATPIRVYASPSCRCCHAWGAHLEQRGFDVMNELVSDVTPLKRKYGVPEQLWSCHTAVVDGYTVEGHVPADLIQKMLAERPTIAGLAAPGMPIGSPGMEGPTKVRYEVISFTRSGDTQVYAVR